MTFKEFCEILEENHIPHNVHFMSNSNWECGPTEMNGLWYNEKENLLIFTQGGAYDDYKVEGYDKDALEWKELTIKNRLKENSDHIRWKEEQIIKNRLKEEIRVSLFDGMEF